MSQVEATTEPGWRPDPSGRFDWRYWDGGWTNRVANSGPAPASTAPTTPRAEPDAAPVGAPVPVPAAAPVAAAATPAAATPAAPMTQAQAAPRVEPFGADVPSSRAAPDAAPSPTRRRRRTPWVWLWAFVRSFAEQPESYHSANAAPVLPSDPRGENMVAAPGNYGIAGIVALAACGIAGGAYLPWLAGRIGGFPFQRTGFDLGHGWGYSVGALALALSALLSVRMRALRWLTMALALVMAGFVTRDLINTYDEMQTMNAVVGVDANVAIGLWITVVSAAIAMIGSVRAGEDEKII